MTTATREIVERLLALQELDNEIRHRDRDLEESPERLAAFREEMHDIEQKIKALDERRLVLKAQTKLRENDLRGFEQKIERLKKQSSEVRTNKEFVAFRSEMANYQGDVDRLQGEILKLMEVAEQAEARIAALREERARVEARVAEARARMAGELAGARRDRDEIFARRPALLDGIPSEPLQLYERVRKAREYAVARMEGEYCSGCMEHLTKNEVINVQNAVRLVQCRGCNRILAPQA
jgi:predicted  nucleic acid-binding Zn-ribbon protein